MIDIIVNDDELSGYRVIWKGREAGRNVNRFERVGGARCTADHRSAHSFLQICELGKRRFDVVWTSQTCAAVHGWRSASTQCRTPFQLDFVSLTLLPL